MRASNWRSKRWALVVVVVAVLAAAVVGGCVSHPPEGTIYVQDLAFDPSAVTVTKGSTITWTNKDQIPVQIQTDDFGTTPTVPGQFSSEPLNPGESFTHTFTDAGKFTYSDPFHPYMTGSVAVK
jgi:plastocyanin